MRDDTPAALPLLALVAGLAGGALAPLALALALAVALLRRDVRALLLAGFVLLGMALAAREAKERAAEQRTFEAMAAARFVTIEAPVTRDWSQRRDAWMLLADEFTANGVAFDVPVAIYTRFEPPAIGMATHIRVESFLRRNERGLYTAAPKSERLVTLSGELPRWSPARWNRALAMRVRPPRYPTESALAEALVLGRGERLGDEVRESFRRGGTYHLLVFSGLQIAFAAGAIAFALRWLHAPRASDWLLLTFAIAAPLFIGPTASVVRASSGIGLYALSRILQRPTSLENLWCLSALVRLIAAPEELTDAAFHLTYAGAGALLFAGRRFHGAARWLSCAVAAELAIIPLTLFHFRQYALGGSLTTIVLSPLIFAMLVLSAVACALPVAPVFEAIGVLHRVCVAVNDVAGQTSGWLAAPPLAAMVVGYSAAMLAIALTRERTRAILVLLAMTIPLTTAIVRGTRTPAHPEVLFLDIGQGDAIAARDGDRVLLVDAGRDANVLPLLADRGIRRIDVAVVTHAHPDHCGGMPAVVTNLSVGEVWINPRRFAGPCATELLEAIAATRTPIRLVRDGEMRYVGSMRIAALLADRPFRKAKENNASIVLAVQIENRRILLTGDIEREAELDLLGRNLRADVLKVAHHGSRTSSLPYFLDEVRPRIAVVSCGRNNLFGHPHATVVAALRERQVRLWRTDRSGTIAIELRRGHLAVRPEIDTSR